MKNSDPWTLALAAWAFSIVATLGSLRYSGIGFLGIEGLGLPPCEMCWYQRILMYPLVGILGHAYLKRNVGSVRLAIGFAVPGAALALYHSLVQVLPHLEIGQCSIGSCTAKMHTTLGLTIPNQSLLGFLLIGAALGMHEWARRVQSAEG